MHQQTHGSWTVAPEVLRALRIKEAQNALGSGDLDQALVEAEELLEAEPDDVDALRVVGQAAMAMGDATLAAEAWSRLTLLRAEDADNHAGLAMARFGMADLEAALEAARVATALRPDLAPGWYYQALANERLGRPEAARQAFERAAQLDPLAFGRAEALPEPLWADALAQAPGLLPPALRRFYGEVQARWEDFPTLDELLSVDPPLSPFTDALYDGTPPVEGDPWSARPDSIRLFRGNLGYPCATVPELAERIARAMTHEALDWLGLTYDEVLRQPDR